MQPPSAAPPWRPQIHEDVVMNERNAILHSALALALLVAGAGTAAAAESDEKATPAPGLPAALDWTFNFNATWGVFGFADSLYTNPKPDTPSGDLSDNWMEGSIKPALGGEYTMKSSAQIYAKASGVGVRTYSTPPSLVGDDDSSFDVDDLYIGWRSGTSLGGGENVLDFKVGRAPYSIGNQLLLGDGAADGGTRGGYWTGARKAFELAAIGAFTPGSNKIEAFYLDKDELPESDSDSKLWGVNYEYQIGEHTTLGGTYMKWSADPLEAPQRDGLDVYNVRVYTAPFPDAVPVSFEAEYVIEDNDDALDSTAWNVLAAYQFETSWAPKISYRYAFFEGDDPATVANEAFDGLFTGFADWGSWWQGEIAGEYFVSNSNLISHQLRVHVTPTDSISTGLIFYDFLLDNPASAGVTADDVAMEIDLYVDWSLNDNFTLSIVAAVAEPGDAIEQSSGRTDTFWYGMLFGAYSF
jgi:hypothetical protein